MAGILKPGRLSAFPPARPSDSKQAKHSKTRSAEQRPARSHGWACLKRRAAYQLPATEPHSERVASTRQRIAFISLIARSSYIPSSSSDRRTLRSILSVSYTHLRAHETDSYLVC